MADSLVLGVCGARRRLLVVGLLGDFPLGPKIRRPHCSQTRLTESFRQRELGRLVTSEERMERILHDLAGDGNGIRDAPERTNGSHVEGVAVHDHRIERRLSILVRRATEADSAIAATREVAEGLRLLTGGDAELDRIKGALAATEDSPGVTSGIGEAVRHPSVDDDGRDFLYVGDLKEHICSSDAGKSDKFEHL